MYERERPKGKHFTPDERCIIERMRKQKYSHAEIAKVVGCCRSAITKELKKGMTKQITSDLEYKEVYTADIAQRNAEYQYTAHSKGLKIGKNFAYLNALQGYLKNHYSPYAAIAKVGSRYGVTISKQTLYRYIQEGLLQGVSYQTLPVGHPKKHKAKVAVLRTKQPLHRSIEKRSKVIDYRNTFGHWEMDSIIGKAKGDNESCLVLTERKHRSEIVVKVNSKTAASTVEALHRIKRQLGKDFSKIFATITVDNGCEFSDQSGIDNTGVQTFYCHPSCPSERGSNENANKLLRRFFPKGESMKKKTEKDAKQAMEFANNYPREMFAGKSSNDLLREELLNLKLENPARVFKFFNIIQIA